jgi:NAD(P)-dependent dehydrogenase (short-subunit alcohol dehydrogenase family)
MKKPNPLAFLKLAKIPPKQTTSSMAGKWVWITGATSGIGLSAVHRFAKGKANQLWLVRNQAKAETLKAEVEQRYGIQVRYEVADFADLPALEKTLIKLQHDQPTIDVLINNAGLHSTKRILTKHGLELTLTVNHLASLLITYACLPLLRKQGKGRIIQVNSEGHRFGSFLKDDPHFAKRRYTGLKGYGASKTAQLLTIAQLKDLLFTQGITINAMHPGEVKSNIGLNNGWLYRWFKKLIINRLLQDNQRSADALYYLAAEPTLATTTGQYFYLTEVIEPAKHALNFDYGKDVLNWSNQTLAKLVNKLSIIDLIE